MFVISTIEFLTLDFVDNAINIYQIKFPGRFITVMAVAGWYFMSVISDNAMMYLRIMIHLFLSTDIVSSV